MEGSSTNIEEVKIPQKTPTFYLHHPCFLLEDIVGALFKCLGFEIGTKTKEENVVKPPSVLEDGSIITEEITPTNEHEITQSSSEQQQCSTITQRFEFIRNLVIRRRGPRRSDLSSGSNPGIN